MDNLCPWSKPQRTWSSPRGYQRQMEPLDRRERHDPFMSRPPFAPPSPARRQAQRHPRIRLSVRVDATALVLAGTLRRMETVRARILLKLH